VPAVSVRVGAAAVGSSFLVVLVVGGLCWGVPAGRCVVTALWVVLCVVCPVSVVCPQKAVVPVVTRRRGGRERKRKEETEEVSFFLGSGRAAARVSRGWPTAGCVVAASVVSGVRPESLGGFAEGPQKSWWGEELVCARWVPGRGVVGGGCLCADRETGAGVCALR